MNMVEAKHSYGKRAGRRVAAWLLILAVCLPFLSACAQRADMPLNVVATIAPLADWARNVGGERVVVRQIVPAGSDPRTYTPSDDDRRAIAEADVLLFNGRGLEPWFVKLLDDTQPRSALLFELGQLNDYNPASMRRSGSRSLLPDDDQPGESARSDRELPLAPVRRSPYVWLDPGPLMAQRGVILIADTLGRRDPDRLLFYRRNADRYNGELDNLDFWISKQVRAWPRTPSARSEVLALQSVDMSWEYFARRYNIDLRMTTSLKSYSPALPETTPLFVDRFVSETEQYAALGLRKPDGRLDPLSHDKYVQLMRQNVQIMTAGVQRAAALHKPQRVEAPGERLALP